MLRQLVLAVALGLASGAAGAATEIERDARPAAEARPKPATLGSLPRPLVWGLGIAAVVLAGTRMRRRPAVVSD